MGYDNGVYLIQGFVLSLDNNYDMLQSLIKKIVPDFYQKYLNVDSDKFFDAVWDCLSDEYKLPNGYFIQLFCGVNTGKKVECKIYFSIYLYLYDHKVTRFGKDYVKHTFKSTNEFQEFVKYIEELGLDPSLCGIHTIAWESA